MPVKPIPPDEPAKPNAKIVSQSNTPTNERPRVVPYRWHDDDENGSKTVPPGPSNRAKGDWMRR
jgi:hypothetical protein